MHTDFCPLRSFSAVVLCRIFVASAGPDLDPQTPALKDLLYEYVINCGLCLHFAYRLKEIGQGQGFL